MSDAAEGSDTTTSNLSLATEQEKQLAASALQEFEKQNYSSCLSVLEKLESTRRNDPKVMHNVAVTTFYKTGRIQELGDVLNYINKQISSDDESLSLETECFVLHYNQAIEFAYQLKYTAAIALLTNIHGLDDEILGNKVAQLLAELYLSTDQVSEVPAILEFLGKHCDGAEKSDDTSAVVALCRARYYQKVGSLKQCRKEMKSINTSSLVKSCVILRAHIESLMSNHNKALRILNTEAIQLIDSQSVSFNVALSNNSGITHFSVGQCNLAVNQLMKAVRENEEFITKPKLDGGFRLLYERQMALRTKYTLLYNASLLLLHSKRPQAAFDLLMEVVRVYHNNAFVWFHLAECCISVNTTQRTNQMGKKQCKPTDVSLGSGIHQKVVLAARTASQRSNDGMVSAAIPIATLEFAAMCLNNAVLLVQQNEEMLTEMMQRNPDALLFMLPRNPVNMSDLLSLKTHLLLCQTYIAICLNDFLMAGHYADIVLEQPNLSDTDRYLAFTYKAEAFVNMDNITQVVELLSTENAANVNLGTRSDEAQAILIYNLAATYAIRGEYDKAEQYLNNATPFLSMEYPQYIYKLKVYLQLVQGQWKKAVQTTTPQWVT